MVVSDTTVLIALGRIGRLGLLEKLWGAVTVPEAVYQEVANDLPGGKEIAEAVKSGWLQVGSVKDQATVRLLQTVGLLGKGESECIVLAKEIGARVILTDDKKARKTAAAGGIETTGTLGLLVQAVREGILTKEDALAAVESLSETGFRLSKTVTRKAIELIKAID